MPCHCTQCLVPVESGEASKPCAIIYYSLHPMGGRCPPGVHRPRWVYTMCGCGHHPQHYLSISNAQATAHKHLHHHPHYHLVPAAGVLRESPRHLSHSVAVRDPGIKRHMIYDTRTLLRRRRCCWCSGGIWAHSPSSVRPLPLNLVQYVILRALTIYNSKCISILPQRRSMLGSEEPVCATLAIFTIFPL